MNLVIMITDTILNNYSYLIYEIASFPILKSISILYSTNDYTSNNW